MSFTLCYREIEDDTRALSKVAKDFLEGQSAFYLQRFGEDLKNAASNAKKIEKKTFKWKTGTETPIVLKQSRWWKGGGTQLFDPIAAEVRFNYDCEYLAVSDRISVIGAAEVRLIDVGSDSSKIVHYDAERGGWSEETSEGTQERSGHPPFHAQFHGIINDIPRMPSFVVHPVDVICITLLDLHQKRWREHASSTSGRSQLRSIPVRQRTRLTAILNKWTEIMREDHMPLVAMQRRLPHAIPL
jgi:hypothetical protein